MCLALSLAINNIMNKETKENVRICKSGPTFPKPRITILLKRKWKSLECNNVKIDEIETKQFDNLNINKILKESYKVIPLKPLSLWYENYLLFEIGNPYKTWILFFI